MRKIIAISIFFFLFAKSAYATDSSLIYGTSASSSLSGCSNPSNATTLDGSVASCVGGVGSQGSDIVEVYGFPSFGISYYASPILKAVVTMNGTDSPYFLRLQDGGGTTQCTATITTPGNYGTNVLGSVTVSFTTGGCSWWNSNYSGIIAGTTNFRFQTVRNSGNQSMRLDAIGAYITYTDAVPTFSLDSSTASASSQLATLNLSGHTATTSANMQCNVEVFQKCNINGVADSSDTPIAHINLDSSDPRTSTTNKGGGYYDGYGFSSTSDAWHADGVEVPYRGGYTCTYPMSLSCGHYDYVCTDSNCSKGDWIVDKSAQGLSAISSGYDPTFIASPSGTSSAPSLAQVDCGGNYICSVVESVKKWFTGLFAPDPELNGEIITGFRNDINARAPFAYISPVFSLDLSDPSTSSAVPTLVLPVASANTYGIPTTYTWTADSSISGIISSIKTVIRMALYLMFVGYIVLLARRVID